MGDSLHNLKWKAGKAFDSFTHNPSVNAGLVSPSHKIDNYTRPKQSVRAPPPVDLTKASNVAARHEVIGYLKRKAFMPLHAAGNNYELSAALHELQTRARIPVTGVYNQQTAHFMERPASRVQARAGHTASPQSGFHFTQNELGTGWEKRHLLYKFGNYSSQVSPAKCRRAVQTAFERGSITAFSHLLRRDLITHNMSTAPLLGNALAHGFPPPLNDGWLLGDIHFDDADWWGYICILGVATHEIGHALALGYSEDPRAVMYPFYHQNHPLANDDISAIISLYQHKSSPFDSLDIETGVPIKQESKMAIVSHDKSDMDVFYFGAVGLVECLGWDEKTRWLYCQIAGNHSACSSGIAAISRMPGHVEVFWVAVNMSIQALNWTQAGEY